jgi:uncharacterized protein (TIGR00369 family)
MGQKPEAKIEFETRDPQFESRVRASFASQRIMHLIGASLVLVEAGVVEIEVPVRDDLTQQDGYVHAGIVTTVLDSACGYAAYTLMPRDSSVLSVEFKVNLLAPARGNMIRAHAEVKRSGRTLTVCVADAFADGKLCATMLATMMCLPKETGETEGDSSVKLI